MIAARLTRPLQRTIYQATGWWTLEAGLELTELRYRATAWGNRTPPDRGAPIDQTQDGARQVAVAVCR